MTDWSGFLFAGVALVTGVRLMASTSATGGVVDRVLHLGMALGMLVMASPLWTSELAAPSYLVFGAGAVWFAARALRSPRGALGSPWAHVVLMLAMVWMSAVMASDAHDPSVQIVLGVVFLVAVVMACGVVLAVDACGSWRSSGRGVRIDHLTHVAMCFGMVITCWPMLGH